MPIQLIEAIWNDDTKTSMTYCAKNEFNQTLNNVITEGHEEWQDTIDKLGGPEAIDQFTERKQAMDLEKAKNMHPHIEELHKRLDSVDSNLDNVKAVDSRVENLENATPAQLTDEDRKAAKLKELFTIKLEAFEIEEVKNSDNKDLRSRIRKSTSAVEISACVAMIMMEAKSAPAKSAPAKATTKKAKTTKGK
tara:strand:- start:15609 stop:16187 length:579 start_codon:yes stop_codon:yes gene_type:complete